MLFLVYLAGLNLAAILLMGIDKRRAKRLAYRIPEATLFSVAVIGGSLGSLIGMYLFRHKTKHPAFVIGMPLILVVQLVLAFILWRSRLSVVFL